MKEIIVKTQQELDALPQSFTETTRIIIKETGQYRLEVTRVPAGTFIEAWGNSNVTARENSNVTARGNSNVTAWGNSNVTAWGNSNVTAWENSNVTARGNSNVTAWENSNVTARENSNVTAWENSNVTAWENSNVTAWGNSNVTARGCVSVHLQSDFASVVLFMFAICFILAKGKVTKKSETATIITPQFRTGAEGWLDGQGIEDTDTIILYKRVSKDFKTQEGQPWETVWTPGLMLAHPRLAPASGECGAGKFHACSFPHFCDEFRDNDCADRYIAIEIAKADLYAWPNPEYLHKIAFRKGTVLYECDKFGKQLKTATVTA